MLRINDKCNFPYSLRAICVIGLGIRCDLPAMRTPQKRTQKENKPPRIIFHMREIISTVLERTINHFRCRLAPVQGRLSAWLVKTINNQIDQMKKAHQMGSSRVPGGEDLMNRMQVADLLGISTGTVDNWRKYLGLPFYKPGHSVYFKRTDVMAFMDRHKGAT